MREAQEYAGMRSSYQKEDVCLLLKDITGLVEPQSTAQRERLIQSGRHYSEMLPIEYVPSQPYMEAYRQALALFARPVANAVGALAAAILRKRGNRVVLVSLARAGTPIGILLRRYFREKCRLEVPHYSISIIRDRGIDHNAMRYLLSRYPARSLLFVDGWIGKGTILGELRQAVAAYPGVSPELAVVADPAYMAELCGTHEDILIPSSCLNATVSGLVSRTVLREDVIGPADFHGAVYYGELQEADLSYDFIRAVECHFPQSQEEEKAPEAPRPLSPYANGLEEIRALAGRLGISDINLVKPGIGEATRVLLRRVPWKVLIKEGCTDEPALTHILQLARERQVPVETYPLQYYKACGVIRKLADT